MGTFLPLMKGGWWDKELPTRPAPGEALGLSVLCDLNTRQPLNPGGLPWVEGGAEFLRAPLVRP